MRYLIIISIATLALCIGGDLGFTALEAAQAAGQPVELSQVPPAVQAEIKTQVANGKLLKLKRTTEDGEIVYEVDLRRNGVERWLTLAVDGRLLSRRVFLRELPEPVKATIHAQIGAGRPEEIYWNDDGGEITYEVEATRKNKKHVFSVAPDGTLASVQVELAEAPEAVRKTIQARAAGASVEEVHRTLEDDEVVYVVDTAKDGKKHTFSVEADGSFLSATVALSETPEPVQKSIRAQLAAGKLSEINRLEDDGEITFEAKVIQNGKKRALEIAVDGKIVSRQVFLPEVPAPAQKTILREIGAGSVLRVDRTAEKNEVTYEVEARKGGKKIYFTVFADGRLQSGTP